LCNPILPFFFNSMKYFSILILKKRSSLILKFKKPFNNKIKLWMKKINLKIYKNLLKGL
jgi:hypothetical protein